MNIKHTLKRFFSQGNTPRFDDSPEAVNQKVEKRNWIIVGVLLILVLLAYCLYVEYQRLHHPSVKVMQSAFSTPASDADFDSNLTKSYLQSVQAELKAVKKQLGEQDKQAQAANQNNAELADKLSQVTRAMSVIKQQLMGVQQQKASPPQAAQTPPYTGAQMTNAHYRYPTGQACPPYTTRVNGVCQPNGYSQDALGYDTQPRYADKPELKSVRAVHTVDATTGNTAEPPSVGIQSFQFASKKSVHTPENYVPAGAFVTAVMTGGADANAGVNGTSDTAPVTFRAINNGFLPNGKKSHLKGCFFTAYTYGEISSSRGIIRMDRMSCTLPNNQILDIPVQGTAFNFGLNGVRGTAVMRNGKIIEMAGVSGVFSGLGSTAKSMSTTQSVSALGSTSTLNPSDALANLAGSSLEAVGSKLSDYYIKLAEQYHPVIELNAGSVVNIVFEKGFSLNPNDKPVEKADSSSANVQQVVQLPDTIKNTLKGAFAAPKAGTSPALPSP